MAHRRIVYKMHTSDSDLNYKRFIMSHCLCHFTQKSLSAALRERRGDLQNYLAYLCKMVMLHEQYWQAKVPAYRDRVPSDNLHIVTIHYSPSLSTKSSFFLPSPLSLSLSLSFCCALFFYSPSCSVVCCLSLHPLSNSCYLVYLWALSLLAVLVIIILSGLSLPSNIHRQGLKLKCCVKYRNQAKMSTVSFLTVNLHIAVLKFRT